MLVAATLHYRGLTRELSDLKNENTLLVKDRQAHAAVIAAQATAIDKWGENQDRIERSVSDIAEAAREARGAIRELDRIFDDHDLEKLAKARPGLVQSRVNRGSDDARRLLECASGSRRADCGGDPAGDNVSAP